MSIARVKGIQPIREAPTANKLTWGAVLSETPSEKWQAAFQKAAQDLGGADGLPPREVTFSTRERAFLFDASEDQVPRFVAVIDRWIAAANARIDAEAEKERAEAERAQERMRERQDRLEVAREKFKDL